jgi:AAA+ ATPase superfamily predicted ATPase
VNRIFFDEGQPLSGRATSQLRVEPFALPVLRRILADHNPAWTPDDLLALWTLTGGVARYVELFMDVGATTRGAMLDEVFGPSSAYIDEGRVVLSDEFGKEGGVYFSILAAIASGRTSYGDIRNAVGEEIGGHLTKLERVYGFVSKARPFRGRDAGRDFHYRIDDAFFRFWFRFVHRYMHLVEQRQRGVLRQIVERDFDAFAGTALERWFRTKLLEEGRYTRVEGWWDRKGENEIDLVCENEADGTLDFREVKTDPRRFDPRAFDLKVAAFFRKNPDLRRERFGVGGLSLEDM